MKMPEFDPNTPVAPAKYVRGSDNREMEGVTLPVTIGLHTVDAAILKFLQTKIRPVVDQDGKQIQVPVIYGNPERWKSVQEDGAIRDKNGKLLLPIMMLRRSSMQKNTIFSPVNKYQRYVFKTSWNPRAIYDKFAVLNNTRPEEVYHSSMVPDHYDFQYEAMIWTEYMEQMNRLIENISFESYEYWGNQNEYRFLTRIDQYEQMTDLPRTSDRLVRNRFTLHVRAYLLPESALDRDGNRGATTKLEFTPKRVIFGTELIIRP